MRDDPEPDDAERGDQGDDRDEHEPDHGHAGGELAVDDVVAIDRLGEQARQRALGSLAVDRVEGEGQAEQRRHQADEDVDPQDADIGRADGEQEQEDGRRAGHLGRRRLDLVGREVERDRGGQAEHDQQDEEADAQQVVAELLGRDHPPARVGNAQDGALGGLGRDRLLRRDHRCAHARLRADDRRLTPVLAGGAGRSSAAR